jgi:hypothetical protein
LGDLYPEHRSNISNSKASSAHKHPSTGNWYLCLSISSPAALTFRRQ